MTELLWPEWFWLPPGFTWQHLRRDPATEGRMFKAQLSDLWVSFGCALLLQAARWLLQATLLLPLGRRLGLSDAAFTLKCSEDVVLEAAFQATLSDSRRPDYAALSKKVGRSEASVGNWFRKRRNMQKANLLTKFCESAWQIVFYSASFAYGIVILWSKPYFWDTKEIWRNWPEHHVTADVYWYYMIELGFYWTALASVSTDTKRKDFREMLVHHLVTIVLMVFSWSLNYTRIGALILVLHDAADPIFNLAKIGSYTRIRSLSDPTFACFLCVWFVTRLGLYPFRIVYTSLFELDAECGTCPALKILQGFLLVLQLLHVIWSYFILKVALRVVATGNRQDSRSDSEESVEEAACDTNR